MSLFLNAARKGVVMQDARFGTSAYFKDAPCRMKLSDVVRLIQGNRLGSSRNRDVTALVWDSRQVVKGSVFFAIRGSKTDGNDFIPEAIQRGAIAVVSDQPHRSRPDVHYIQTRNPRIALAKCARHFYGSADAKLHLVGVTGTNGKTTVTRLIKHLLDEDADRCGLIGTIDYIVGQRVLPSHKTTPEVDETCALLAEMVEAGCASAVMEVSSHGIDQNRTWGLQFDTLAFLNLSQDHLDYHGDMEQYFASKARLFEGSVNPLPRQAVINVDDAAGRRLREQLPESVRCISFATEQVEADFRATRIHAVANGTRFLLHSPEGQFDLKIPLVGHFNVSNALAAIACAYASGLALNTILQRLSKVPSVPGRMEVIAEEGTSFLTVVDYAHTHDALEKLLLTVRALTPGRLHVVFGCGGDRDRAKRPLMMQTVCRLADEIVATADNPRTEAQQQIFDDMRTGQDAGASVRYILDREAAIHAAIAAAEPGDAVVIAGKGHETFQIVENSMIPFDDRLVARAALKELCNQTSHLLGDH